MREIKFRAWIEDVPQTHEGHYRFPSDPENSGIDEYGYLINLSGELQDGRTDAYYGSEERMGVLEQYTGLRDKNGVEIYEGDIFSLWKDDSAPQVVTWNRCGFSPLVDEEYIEVIGNIHENPELLK